jgi:hypothetical protein
MRRLWPMWLPWLMVAGALFARELTTGRLGVVSGSATSPASNARRPPLTDQDAKAALVGMLRAEADRDVRRCREFWGSDAPDRELAAVPITRDRRGDPRIGAFDVILDEAVYRFWAGGGVLWYEGSLVWEAGRWHATRPRLIGKGCIIHCR